MFIDLILSQADTKRKRGIADGNKKFFGFGQARDKPVRNYSNGEYTFNFGRSTSGKSVNEMTAMQTTAVYARVRILSEAIASLERFGDRDYF